MMVSSPTKDTRNMVRFLSPSKEVDGDITDTTPRLTKCDHHISCASGKYCTTPNEPVPLTHTCVKCKKKSIFGVEEMA